MTQAPPATVASWVQGHWYIENKLHWVRYVVFDEDRHQLKSGRAPQVMATLRNTGISLLRLNAHPRSPPGYDITEETAAVPIELLALT